MNLMIFKVLLFQLHTGQPYISSIPLLIDYIVPVQQFGQKNRRIFFQQQNSEGQL
jgi:hypothetical protein